VIGWQELADLFETIGLGAIQAREILPIYGHIRDQGGRGGAWVPFRCQAWAFIRLCSHLYIQSAVLPSTCIPSLEGPPLPLPPPFLTCPLPHVLPRTGL
jgi:hypothetical protein